MTNISINKLHEFKDHPYQVLDNDEMNSLIKSVQQQGIMTPLIVRPLEGTTDEYEIISGHRRFRAAQKAGLTEVPAFIRPVSRDEAAIMVVDSNLHREHLLPSEKAFAYKLKLEALKRQGKRSDLTLSQFATKLDTASAVGQDAGESRDTVYRYIRLTKLIPELLQLMDDEKIAFSVGVELSYLSDNHQLRLLEIIERDNCTPSYSQAFRMHRAFKDNCLDSRLLERIMSEEKPNQREVLKISMEKVRRFAPKASNTQFEDFVIKACEHYRRYLNKNRDRGR
jgi:ParB family chromosome partitioning protein